MPLPLDPLLWDSLLNGVAVHCNSAVWRHIAQGTIAHYQRVLCLSAICTSFQAILINVVGS